MLKRFIFSVPHFGLLQPITRFCVVRSLTEKLGDDDDVDFKDSKSQFLENLPNKTNIQSLFQKVLHCSKEKATELYDENKKSINFLTFNQISRQIEMLMEIGVDREIMLNYPWVMTLNPQRLKIKLELINDLHPRSINDFVPLLQMSVSELARMKHCLLIEANQIPGSGNRIYYMADKLKISPHVVSLAFANSPFIVEVPLRMIFRSLDVLTHYNVAPENILRDLWVFNYAARKTRDRLEMARNAQRPKLMPWMARCPMSLLEKSLRQTVDNNIVLGECETVEEYVAKRLNLDKTGIGFFVSMYPAALKVRPTKIKSILDYLLDEAKFTTAEVARAPRILCFSLPTVKQRVEHLKKLNLRPPLIVLCLTKREFTKYVEKLSRRKGQTI